MKKMIALFMAFVFALTLGVAFAEESATGAAEKAPAAEKTPAKHKKHVKRATKKHKEAKKETAAPATK